MCRSRCWHRQGLAWRVRTLLRATRPETHPGEGMSQTIDVVLHPRELVVRHTTTDPIVMLKEHPIMALNLLTERGQGALGHPRSVRIGSTADPQLRFQRANPIALMREIGLRLLEVATVMLLSSFESLELSMGGRKALLQDFKGSQQ
ncbi:hypothetical protein BBJ28_00025692 [Nothophytophthora sp. Chile5]|nr:hypothetical protein BBJ28_00025692 [Nothophytophthora sp. Chile5]